MSERVTLETVLWGERYICDCREVDCPRVTAAAAAVRAWLLAELGREDVREAVAEAIARRTYGDHWEPSPHWELTSHAALDAVARMVGGAE